MEIKKHLLPSTIIHLIALLLPLLFGSNNGGGKLSPKDVGTIVPKPTEPETVEEVELIEISDNQRRKTTPHSEEKCADFYGGIGITHNSFAELNGVFPGYPAFNAGLRVGDRVLTPINLIRGEVGTPLTLEYIKAGEAEVRKIVLIRDKICTSGLGGDYP